MTELMSTFRSELARLPGEIQQANEARMQLEELFQARDDAHMDRFTEAEDTVAHVDAKLMQLWAHAAGLTEKADESDLRELKQVMNRLALDVKEKSQAVLFGARCLSCNRVFDDVEQQAGVVDVHADKQQAKLYAEMQRALHTPSADPLNSIKMLAVKVGRPGSVIGAKSGGRAVPFQSRDGASIACDVADVKLMPTSFGMAKKFPEIPRELSTTPSTCATRPGTSNQAASRPGTSGQACSLPAPRPGTSGPSYSLPSAPATAPPGPRRESNTPRESKPTLAQLVGRS